MHPIRDTHLFIYLNRADDSAGNAVEFLPSAAATFPQQNASVRR
jgi:hypothetical protein